MYKQLIHLSSDDEVINQLVFMVRGRREEGKEMQSISDSALHSHSSLCLFSSIAWEKSCSGKTFNQSLTSHDSTAVIDSLFD